MNYHTGTTMHVTNRSTVNVGSVKNASLAPLIRAPVVPMAAGHGRRSSQATTSGVNPTQSGLKFTQTVNETRRHEKLRAVLALMGSNKARNRRRKKTQDNPDDTTETVGAQVSHMLNQPLKASMSRLTVANLHPSGPSRLKRRRKMSVVSNSTQSSDRGRRGAIFTGNLPVRSFPEEPSEDDKRTRENSKRKRKVKVRGGKFRVVAKLIVLLVRFCRTYILTENDAKMIRLFSAIDAAQAGDRYKIKSDLIFDVTQFRANKQCDDDDIPVNCCPIVDLSFVFEYRISNDTKRILGKEPDKRTDQEITHVQVELQPLQFVKRYPVSMQRSMIQVAWYEEFTQGRVITRFGKQPQAFYLILEGSALILEGDPENSGRDATAAEKGHVFGNQAIANRSSHQVSVISKEQIHLLCLSVEDYSRIFLAGGLQNFSDVDDGSFIRSLFLFDGWPIHLLKDNPTKVKFNYYTQGTLIVEDSDSSEWIYIIKSGSCSVMKRFHHKNEKPNVPSLAKKRRKVPVHHTKAVRHEQKLSQKLQELQRKRTKKMKGSWRPDLWKPNLLSVPLVKDPLDDCADDHQITPATKQINVVSCSSSYDVNTRQMKSRSEAVDAVDVLESVDQHANPDAIISQKQSGKLLPYQRITFAKGPYLTHVKPVSQEIKEHPPKEQSNYLDSNNATTSTQGDTLQGTPNLKEQPNEEPKEQTPLKSRDKKQPMYVQIDTLEKGDIFGILDIAFGKQLPSMSLVSNGVECIEISKRFYMKHAGESIVKAVTDKMRPYATEDTLTKDLQEKLTWKDHRESTMKNTARKFKRYRKMLADPRLPRPALLPDV